MTLETMSAVVEDLKRREIHATLEYPGFINVDNRMQWGDSGDTVSCDVVDDEMQVVEGAGEWYDSSIPRDSEDVKRIADHIACSWSEFSEATK